MKHRKMLIGIAVVVLCVLLLGAFALLGVNAYVKGTTRDRIVTAEEASDLSDVDCILVLGCLVRSDGSPSDMLADRLYCGIALYRNGVSPKLLMSGDHGSEEYDEVSAMKGFAIAESVPSEDIFMDHAGFNTYESLYRAREVFGAEKIVIVTQEYHLYRALYIAEQLDMEAYGVAADAHTYRNQWVRDLREILARNKDALVTLFRPKSTYLGDPVDLSGSGDVTNDRYIP